MRARKDNHNSIIYNTLTKFVSFYDTAYHQYQYTHTSGNFSEVRQIQFTQWDGFAGVCLLTETRPNGTSQFEWNPETFESLIINPEPLPPKQQNIESGFDFKGQRYKRIEEFSLSQGTAKGNYLAYDNQHPDIFLNIRVRRQGAERIRISIRERGKIELDDCSQYTIFAQLEE